MPLAFERLSPALRKYFDRPEGPPGWLRRLAAVQKARRERWREEGTPFYVGQKRIYLPKFHIAFLRTPHLSPSWARFRVPLNFNKLDIRDYLWHAYGVRVLSVRSYIKHLPPVMVNDPDHIRTLKGKRPLWRPRPLKNMTVELASPFVWPDEPTAEQQDALWDKKSGDELVKTFKAGQRVQGTNVIDRGYKLGPGGDVRHTDQRASEIRRTQLMEQQANKLLSGEVKWGDLSQSNNTQAS